MSLTDLNSIRHTFTEDQIERYIKFHQNIMLATCLSVIFGLIYLFIYY